ncbi:DoxX family protein [Nocardia sp. CDC159]|uniref:DoxX family protein n=1 Tax=Nocardia pulmonis TaxID=2951408 RepID=A0A9X2ECX9_9NOCA|nr:MULTISPECIES: DoxX family protein [Nocardia]MCM6778174.1 DoxX family protein [Nocardia pulmonis]MCM6791063.1 DoxX family protein [Nocardia sp. CDC159]
MTADLTAGSSRRLAGATDSQALDIGLLVLRVIFGGLMLVHGSQKLFGWFNGPGLQQTNATFDQMGYNPGKVFGTLAGLCEFTGGALLLLGLLTPLGAAIVIGTMINAMNATWKDGLAGYESGLLFAAAAVTLAFAGPGRLSLDHGRPWGQRGITWGGGAVVVAVVAALITLALKWWM